MAPPVATISPHLESEGNPGHSPVCFRGQAGCSSPSAGRRLSGGQGEALRSWEPLSALSLQADLFPAALVHFGAQEPTGELAPPTPEWPGSELALPLQTLPH